jgi:hypothetical protein
MIVSILALAAVAAAGMASAQTKWVPLDQAHSDVKQPPHAAPTPARAPAQTTAPVDAAQARAEGLAQARQALAGSKGQSVRAAMPGIALWRNVVDGMSAAQLRALYPQGRDVTYKDDRTVLGNVEVIPGCEAKVNIMHPSGVVSEIVMRGDGAIAGRCSLKLITALSGKYGEPMDKDAVGQSLFGRHGKNYIWAHDGVTLQFKRYTGGILGGDGLLQASWELRYSAADTKIDL